MNYQAVADNFNKKGDELPAICTLFADCAKCPRKNKCSSNAHEDITAEEVRAAFEALTAKERTATRDVTIKYGYADMLEDVIDKPLDVDAIMMESKRINEVLRDVYNLARSGDTEGAVELVMNGLGIDRECATAMFKNKAERK